MKKIAVLFLLTFSVHFTYSFDTLVTEVIDTTKENTVALDKTQNKLEDSEALEENAQKNAQWFMYGFLALGAVLVFWKFKNNK